MQFFKSEILKKLLADHDLRKNSHKRGEEKNGKLRKPERQIKNT
jgi:hypothetical protein